MRSNTPTRRRLLATAGAALGTGLAGCVSTGYVARGNRGDSGNDDRRRVTLAAADDVPSGHAVTIAVDLLAGDVTADRTARLRVTTINEGSRRALSVGTDGCCLFNRNRAGSEPAGLWLHRPNTAESVERDGDRWTRDAPADRPRAYPAYACLSRTYAAGESVSNEYVVWDDYRTAGYMRPGTYRFAESVAISPPGSDFDADPDAEFEWGFDLRVERP